jgi:hypothetical protein
MIYDSMLIFLNNCGGNFIICSCNCICIVFIVCNLSFIVCVVLYDVFCWKVVSYSVGSVLCLIVVPLPPGKTPFAVKVNNRVEILQFFNF